MKIILIDPKLNKASENENEKETNLDIGKVESFKDSLKILDKESLNDFIKKCNYNY